MSNPWFKFYPQDWMGDEGLKTCSLAAQGLWTTMLCIMHRAKHRGFLSINGHPVTDTQLASLTGTDESTVSRLRLELETAGVYSRNDKGVIYSRRMTADERAAKAGAKHVKKRWKKANENKQESLDPNRGANGLPFTQKPEAIQKEELRFNGKVVRLTPQDWDDWKAEYRLSEAQLKNFMISRDDFLAGLPDDDPRRVKWWMPTKNWMNGQCK